MPLRRTKTVAIMQPTYLPWVGYFDLIDHADEFIFLDSVQYARRSWQQRNRIRTLQGELMLTVPVSKGPREQKICDVKIDSNSDFVRKHLCAIEQSYKKAPFFGEVFPALAEQYKFPLDLLVDLNISLIKLFSQLIGLSPSFRKASEILDVESRKVDLLLDLCLTVGATEYLSPPGSKVYIDADDRFAEKNISLRYQMYEPQKYEQVHGPDFLPFMSILDLLMNVGLSNALGIIRSGRIDRIQLMNKEVLETI